MIWTVAELQGATISRIGVKALPEATGPEVASIA
jgi:hypothetical protein